MATPYTVFVSSTYLDNVERRKLVDDAIINADMKPVGMERFTASVRPTVDECARMSRDSDVLLGIIARRYGWMPDGADRSITEIEYDAARERLMFVIDDAAPARADTDYDDDDRETKAALLEGFKKRIAKDQMAVRFTDGTLQLKVYLALTAWRESKERVPIPVVNAGDQPPIYEGPSAVRRSYFYDIDGIARFYAEPFVGRDELLRDVSEFASNKEPGYLVVLAPAGYGKTALFFRILRLLAGSDPAARPSMDVVCFFARPDGDGDGSSEFFVAVNSQLLDVLNLQGGVPQELAAQRYQFAQLWRRAAARASKERPLLLLVDGLDEFHVTATSFAQLLPATLNPYVHVVCSSQPFPDPKQSVAVDHPLRAAPTRRLPELAVRDVEQLLAKHGLMESSVRALTERVFELTNGVPLYTRFVCADVAEAGADALDRLQRAPPAGVREYFGRQLKQLEQYSRQSGVLEALGLLLVSRGPMKLEELADALERPLHELRIAFEPIRRFTVGEERLALMHDELTRAMQSWFAPAERRRSSEHLLRWCASYADRAWPEETPEYVLERFADHLYEAGDFDGLEHLLASEWVHRQKKTLGSYAPLVRAINHTIDAAAASHPSHLKRELNGYVKLAVVASVSGYVPSAAVAALAVAGNLTQARTYAEMIIGPYDRAAAFIAIGDAFAARDERAKAHAALVAALSAIAALGTQTVLFDSLRDLSLVAARVGDFGILERALEIAQQHPSSHLRVGALCGVALGFASLPDGKSRAVAIARSMLHGNGEEHEVGIVAKERLARAADVAAACGDDDLSRDVCERADAWRGPLKPDVLAACAVSSSRLGRTADGEQLARRAIQAARALRGITSRAQSLSRCAETLATAPELVSVAKNAAVAAVNAARTVKPGAAKDSGLEATCAVVVEQYAALATAEELDRLYAELAAWRRSYPSVTALIAIAMARAGAVERGVSVLAEVSAERREMALHDMGRALVANGRVDEAQELTKRITRAWDRADILAHAAREHAKAGRTARATELAQRAIAESESIAPGAGSLGMAVGIGEALRELGDVEGARRVAGQALRAWLPLKAHYAVYDDLTPAIDALVDADAFQQAYELALIVGALGGYMIDQGPPLSEQLRAFELAARGWRHRNDASKLKELVSRVASLAATIDTSVEYASCDDVETMLAYVRILDLDGQRAAAIESARAAMHVAFRIPDGNDPRIPLLADLISVLAALDQPSLAREAASKILEALDERDRDSPWWRHDRAIVAQALARGGMREKATEIAKELVTEARASLDLLGESSDYLPSAVELLGANAADDLAALREDAARLPGMEARASAFSMLAVSLHRMGNRDDALACLRQALESERRAGSSNTLEMLEWTAPILAGHDRALLRDIYESFCESRDVLVRGR